MSNATSTAEAPDAAISSLVSSYQATLNSVSIKAVGSQLAIMSALSVGTVLMFSWLRPENKRVYAPKVKFLQQISSSPDPLAQADGVLITAPPPNIGNGFFSWFSPVLHTHEQAMLQQIGLDGCTFLRILRLLRLFFTGASVLCGGVLIPINVVYNLKVVSANSRNWLSILTIENLSGTILFVHVGIGSYGVTALLLWLIWFNWKKMVLLRQAWFRSDDYRKRIYSRTLMITEVPKDYRTDDGLVHLMGKLRVDGLRVQQNIECTSIGRVLGDFPELVEDHNEAVKELEGVLVKYLRTGQPKGKRPLITRGAFMGMGGHKMDAIEYHSKKIKVSRDKIDVKRAEIDSLIRKDRQARKNKKAVKPHGENYGFVTMRTIAEAHRLVRTHRGRQKELGGAIVQLAPQPQDIIWKNLTMDPARKARNSVIAFLVIAFVCFINTVPLAAISLLANLSALTIYVPFLNSWQSAGKWGDWTFSLVSGILPSIVSGLFSFLLPVLIRRLTKFAGKNTRSGLDRNVIARYYFFLVFSFFLIFSLIGVAYSAIAQIVIRVGKHESFSTIINSFSNLDDNILSTYVGQSTYWLTVLPLRGFLVVFEIAQLIKLLILSVQKLLFAKTPRDIKEATKPGNFDYPVVLANLLFIVAVGLIYAPLAPLVCIFAAGVFWISSLIYKYQLLYVYVSRTESGGRLFNVAINRILSCVILMQLALILTIGLDRKLYTDVIAASPPVLITLLYKFFVIRPLEKQFLYYNPSTAEIEEEQQARMREKDVKHSDIEKRFLHPFLLNNRLFTVMVHKKQEEAARLILSEYPWFNKSRDIKAVRPENLEFDAIRDNKEKDETQTEVDWDARSVASTDMLGTKSEMGSGYNTPDVRAYLARNQSDASQVSLGYTPGEATDSRDDLFANEAGSGQLGRKSTFSRHFNRANASEDPIAHAPLLNRQESEWGRQASNEVGEMPYPPTYYSPPRGYSPAPSISDYSAVQHAGTPRGEPAELHRTYSPGEAAYPPSSFVPRGYGQAPLTRASSQASSTENHSGYGRSEQGRR